LLRINGRIDVLHSKDAEGPVLRFTPASDMNLSAEFDTGNSIASVNRDRYQ